MALPLTRRPGNGVACRCAACHRDGGARAAGCHRLASRELPAARLSRFPAWNSVSVALKGYLAPSGNRKPTRLFEPVSPALLQEATAKSARRPVQSERPGHTAGAFAFCGVRIRAFATRGCVRKGLWARASGVARPSAWPTVAGVLADCLSLHRETFPRSGVSVERSRPGDVSEVITADSEGCLPGPSSHCSAAWLPRIPRGALETASCRPNA